MNDRPPIEAAHALFVRMGDAFADVDHDPQSELGRERPAAGSRISQDPRQRFAVDELDHSSPPFFEVNQTVDLDDVRVPQLRHERGLSLETRELALFVDDPVGQPHHHDRTTRG